MGGTVQKSLRIPRELARQIEEVAELTDQDFSTIANQLLAESLKMRRCPGIIFADGPLGRRARIAGTGLDVWEVIAVLRSLGGDVRRLKKAYPWLSEAQWRAAIGYYSAFPEEVDRLIELNERWSPERLEKEHPALAAKTT